jgi:hypothetical protein
MRRSPSRDSPRRSATTATARHSQEIANTRPPGPYPSSPQNSSRRDGSPSSSLRFLTSEG